MVKLLRALVLALPCACHDENPRFTLEDVDESTTEAASSGETSTGGTTTAEPTTIVTTTQFAPCGDGVVEHPFELCDDGPLNAEMNACKSDCQPNYCGDGFVYVGVEACDDGNLYGFDDCDQSCMPTPNGVDLGGAELLTDIYGTTDGTLHEDGCEVLLGFYGVWDPMTGAGTLGGVCGELSLAVVDDVFVIEANPTGESLPAHGGLGYEAWSRMCPPGRVITGVSGADDGSSPISELIFLCSELVVTHDGTSYALAVTNDQYIESLGLAEDGPTVYAVCPLGYVATGQRIYEDLSLLAGVEMTCKQPALSM